MKKIVVRLLILITLVGAAWGGYKLYQSIPKAEEIIATAKVRKGDVIVRSYSRGELRAVRSAMLTAPNLFGTVQVTRMAQLGSFAREKDLVIEFDDSEVLSRLEEKQLELDQIDEQIKKAKAELAIRNNQDQVELLRARYSVRRAELEVKRNELVSPIDAQRNLLTLDESNQRLKQLESDIKSRLESAEAELAVLSARKSKSQLELERERSRLTQVKLLSPMSGLVSVRQNLGGGFRMMGSTVPDIREGDQVQPGMPVADVLDLSELEVSAKVGELDRANLHEGQEVNIRLDAIPDRMFDGRIKSMSATASSNMFSGDPAKKFDVVFSIDMKQLLSTLGAKPEQIARMMATAEQNRRKPPMEPAAPMAMAGGAPGMMMAGGDGMAGPQGPRAMAGGAPGEGPGGPGGGGRGGGRLFTMGPGGAGRGGQGGGGEDRQKMREAMQKALGGKSMQDLTPEERTAMFQKLQKENPTLFAGRAPGGRQRGEGGQTAEGAGQGRGRRGGGADALTAPMGVGLGGASNQRFSLKEIAAAQLPPPPGEDSQLDVLLRPGLLADVEIIVEKIPDAIHVPAQAVIEKEGKMIVYVQNGGRWEAREVKPLKQSESTMVIASGLKPDEVVALSDPTVRPSDKEPEKPQSGGGMPVPGAGGGRRGR